MYYTSRNIPVSKLQTWMGIIFSTVVGTFLHFVFQWSMDHPAAALFGAVNESIWEHLKLLFFPVVFYTIFQCILLGDNISGFLWARTLSVLAGMALIISGFYTYSGILGRNFLIADITLFIAGVSVTFLLTCMIQKKRRNSPAHILPAIFILLLLTFLFFIFTYYPPHIGLFLDPVSGGYGIGHSRPY